MEIAFGFIFSALLVGGNLLSVQGTVYNSPDTAMRFSHCLIEKMGESQMFTPEDRNNMVEVANVMSEALLNQQLRLPPRIPLTAFMTSLADVVTHEDPVKNADRKGFYATALEQCSVSTIGYTDSEFIDLSLGILSSIESIKFSAFGEAGLPQRSRVEVSHRNANPGGPNVFNPLGIQPSPAQNPGGLNVFNPVAVQPPPVQNPRGPNVFNPFAIQSPSVQNPGGPNVFNPFAVQSPPVQNPGGPNVFNPLAVQPYPVQNSGGPNFFNPLSVQPSPVQNPHYPGNFNPSDKTNFEMLKPYPMATNTNPLFQIPPASNRGISSGANVPQQEAGLVSMSSSDTFQGGGYAFASKTSEVAPSFGGLNIPQTKESSVVVIPSTVNNQPVENVPLSQPSEGKGGTILQPTIIDSAPQPQKDTGAIVPSSSVPQEGKNYPLPRPSIGSGETVLQPTTMSSVPQPQKNTDVISSSSLPQAGGQNQDSPSNSPSESVILNALIGSPTFRNIFNFNIPQGSAVNLARSLAEKSLEGYNLDITNAALTAVSDEVAKVSFQTPENYALAISNAFTGVLKSYNLPVDGSQIATNFLSNLENAKGLPPQSEIPSYEVIYPVWSEKQVDFDFDSPPLAPEDREGELFSEALAQHLSESSELSKFFCNIDAPESKMNIYFRIIKSSLAGYSLHVSPIAASIASSALTELSKEELCSNYARTISDVIAEILDENRLLQGADAVNIAKQMEFGLIQLNVSAQTESTTIYPPHKETTSVVTTLQTSFPDNFKNMNSTSASFSQSRGDYVANPIQILDPEHEINAYSAPVTTPYTAEITDEEFISATTFVESIGSVTEPSPTESSFDWAPGGVIDQEELASHLLEELETVLEAYFTEDEREELDLTAGDVLAGDEVSEYSAESEVLASDSLQPEEKIHSDNINHSVAEEKQNDSPSQSQSIPPDCVLEECVDTKPKSGDLTEQKQSSSPENTSSVKKELVELQPSFQGPPLTEYPTRSVPPLKSNSDVVSEDLSIAAAREMSRIATSAIAYIRSGNYDINNLCARVNDLAPIVNIPPLEYCVEVAAIDYLLNVLNSLIKIVKGI